MFGVYNVDGGVVTLLNVNSITDAAWLELSVMFIMTVWPDFENMLQLLVLDPINKNDDRSWFRENPVGNTTFNLSLGCNIFEVVKRIEAVLLVDVLLKAI